MIRVDIDPGSGFCFGVVNAVRMAEEFLASNPGRALHCLGHVVHNAAEVRRLEGLGMSTASLADIDTMPPSAVMVRAHGEPPATYDRVAAAGHTLLDATCPVVLGLQRRIRAAFLADPRRRVVIFGKPGHAEVVGLQGQTDNTAVVVTSADDLKSRLLPTDSAILFSQTTMSPDDYADVVAAARIHCRGGVECHDTICASVRNCARGIEAFAAARDAVVFISGKDSSNGKILFAVCRAANPRSWLVETVSELRREWFADGMSVGVCGATSTPLWLMEEAATAIRAMFPG